MSITPRKTSEVFYQGDDIERLSELRRAADAATRNSPLRIGDVPDGQAERDAYDAFVDEAADRATVVHLQALPRKRFRSLMAAHPPTDSTDKEDAEAYGVDPDGMAEDFFPASIERMDPEPADGRQAFLDSLSDGDFERLFATAYWLNRAPGGDASESRYSSASRSSDAT